MLKLKVEQEKERINNFERKWKKETSEEKFRILLIAQYKKMKTIKVIGKEIPTSKGDKFLGLKIQSTGIVGHCANVKNKGNAVLTNLR